LIFFCPQSDRKLVQAILQGGQELRNDCFSCQVVKENIYKLLF